MAALGLRGPLEAPRVLRSVLCLSLQSDTILEVFEDGRCGTVVSGHGRVGLGDLGALFQP